MAARETWRATLRLAKSLGHPTVLIAPSEWALAERVARMGLPEPDVPDEPWDEPWDEPEVLEIGGVLIQRGEARATGMIALLNDLAERVWVRPELVACCMGPSAFERLKARQAGSEA